MVAHLSNGIGLEHGVGEVLKLRTTVENQAAQGKEEDTNEVEVMVEREAPVKRKERDRENNDPQQHMMHPGAADRLQRALRCLVQGF